MEISLLIFLVIIAASVITGIVYTGIKSNRLFKKNLERLGVKFDGKFVLIRRFEWHIKGLKIRYTHSMKSEDQPNNISLSVFHQRSLNSDIYMTNILGIYLGNAERLGISSWYSPILHLTTRRFGTKEVGLPEVLNRRSIKCWASDEQAVRHMLSGERVKSSLIELSDRLKPYQGEFIITDLCVTMRFPDDAVLDSGILDTVYTLSTDITSSGAIPSAPVKKTVQETVFRFFLISLLLTLIGLVLFSIIMQMH
ncbi:MAG: hypothetical protein HY097_09740 [Nitrospinae bacterium]|nr:hypothetical protein [Nitrospinota bacterium]MBI3813802.1 hypothetical protein [Nitrospinota bacterium]